LPNYNFELFYFTATVWHVKWTVEK